METHLEPQKAVFVLKRFVKKSWSYGGPRKSCRSGFQAGFSEEKNLENVMTGLRGSSEKNRPETTNQKTFFLDPGST